MFFRKFLVALFSLDQKGGLWLYETRDQVVRGWDKWSVIV